ncbi:bpX5 domain-containing protein [Kitasatospora sp. NPDC054939]
MTSATPPAPSAVPASAVPASAVPPAPAPAFPLRWERREPPLPAAAVLALGDALPALAAATRTRLLAGARLAVLADDAALLVLGAAAELPWADGARYLGRDADLLVPTTARPLPAAPALWRSALGARPGLLCALVPGHALVADPPPPAIDPAALDRFLRPAPAVRATAVPAAPVTTATEPGPAEAAARHPEPPTGSPTP